METINPVMSFAGAMFGRLPQEIPPLDATSLAAIIIVLSVLAAAPRSLSAILGSVALAGIGVFVLFASNFAMVLFVLGCGLIGIVRSRHITAVMQRQLDKLARGVHELELAENRRLIQELNSPSPSIEGV